MRQLQLPEGRVHSLRFSPDGRSLFAITQGPYDSEFLQPQKLYLYQHAYRIDVLSGELLNTWEFRGSEVAIFTPDLRSVCYSVSVAVSGGELDLRSMNLMTRTEEPVYEAEVPYPYCLDFTPNGHILAIGGLHYFGDGRDRVHRVDVWNKTELAVLDVEARCLAYSPNGQWLATGHLVAGVHLWEGKQPVKHWAEPAWVLAWSPDGRLAWVNETQCAMLTPPSQGPVRTWQTPMRAPTALAFSPDGNLLLVGSFQGACALHSASEYRERTAYNWGIGSIYSVAFSPDGLTCAAGGENGQVVVWDVDG